MMILTIDSGSSSIKFALYKQATEPEKIFSGQIRHIGFTNAEFSLKVARTGKKQTDAIGPINYKLTIHWLISKLEKQINFSLITAIGHRVVHGMRHTEPALITSELLKELKKIIPYDPDHLPYELKLIETFEKFYPKLVQFACFDTAFHQTMPRVAKQLPIPHRFEKLGVQRYGFHGLSYQYLMQELKKQAGKEAASGRVILAHLGNGASLAAVYKGNSIDTGMGFTPAGGLVMSSRSGDLDPGVCWLMMQVENLSPVQFNHLINHESGLLGISETSGDMETLMQQEVNDVRSAEAINLFCYQVKKYIGAYSSALGGIDNLIFSGGIGENAPAIRARICEGLNFLGIELDEKRNNQNEAQISTDKGRVIIRVIPTDEEWMIAQMVQALMADLAELNEE